MSRPVSRQTDCAADAPCIPPAIRAAAADWLARRDAGLTTRDEADYAAWLEADPVHRAAAEQIDFAWGKLDRPLATGTADAVLGELARRARARRQRRGLARAAATMVVLIGAGFIWQAMSRPASPAPSASVASATVLLPAIQSLPDESIAELRDGAEIVVEFSELQRRIVLRSGEVFFKVAKNPARPFVVVAGGVEIRAVGTAFSVDRGAGAVEVVVTEGRVAVAVAPTDAASLPEPLLLGAGQGTIVATDARAAESEIRAVSAEDILARHAWRGPRLEFSGTPLIEAVALLNRHNRVQFLIEDAELAHTRVSGIFGATNTEAFVRLLQASFNVEIARRGDAEIVLRRRP